MTVRDEILRELAGASEPVLRDVLAHGYGEIYARSAGGRWRRSTPLRDGRRFEESTQLARAHDDDLAIFRARLMEFARALPVGPDGLVLARRLDRVVDKSSLLDGDLERRSHHDNIVVPSFCVGCAF